MLARAEEKSISTDRTMASDLLTEADVARELLRGAGEVAERARHAGRVARTVGIKIRFADFTTVTRVRTLADPTDAARWCTAEALQLYRALRLDQARVRLVGVKLENLRSAGEATQLALDLEPQSRRPQSRPGLPIRRSTRWWPGSASAVVRPASLLDRAVKPRPEGRNRARTGSARNSPGADQITNHLNLPANPTT